MAKRNVAVVLAGGKGSRMGTDIPKQFFEINGKTVLEYSVEDAHNHRPPPAGIVFRIGTDNPRYYEKIREGLCSLRNAVGRIRC